MDKTDREELKKILQEVVLTNQVGYPEEHRVFVTKWIEKEQRRQELWEKAKAQVIGTGLIAVLGYIIMVVWDAIHSNGHN